MVISEIIYSTAKNKCSRCHQGDVFESKNPYSFKNGLKMKESCSVCNLKYEREPGFFYGALYVSYALMSGIFITWYVVDQLWLQLDPIMLIILVVSSMLILFPVAYRWARLLWLNFFVRFDKKYSKEKSKHYHAKVHSFGRKKISTYEN